MFESKLEVRAIDEKRWELLVDLYYRSALIGPVVVPAGFITDFASVPRLPFAYMLLGGRGQAAAVVHDWLYSTRELPRKVADDVFHEALGTLGHSAPTRFLMWAGVRLGGWWAWKQPNLRQPPAVADEMYGGS